MRALLIILLTACWFGSDGARAQSQSSVNWSGFYLGGNLGAVTGASDLNAGVRADTTYFNTGTDSDQVAAPGSGTLRQGRFTGEWWAATTPKSGTCSWAWRSAPTCSTSMTRARGRTYSSRTRTFGSHSPRRSNLIGSRPCARAWAGLGAGELAHLRDRRPRVDAGGIRLRLH